MARGQLQAVTLIEVTEPDDDASRLAQSSRVAARRRRSAVWAAALVLVLAGGAVVARERERGRDAFLATLPGVLAPLSTSVHELWRAPTAGLNQFEDMGSTLLSLALGPDAVPEITAIDPDTGVERWTARFPEGSAAGSIWCVRLADTEDGPAAQLACQVTNGQAVDIVEAAGTATGSGVAQLVVLDAGSGARVAQRELGRADLSMAPLGRDLILAEVLADGQARVRREDAVTGAVRWTFQRDWPEGTPGNDPPWISAYAQNGKILVSGILTCVLALDGQLLGTWQLTGGPRSAEGGWWLDVTVLPDGRYAVGESGGARGDDRYGTVSTTDARDGFAIPGPVVTPSIDDGSAPGLLLTMPVRGSGLVAQDSRTGRTLWRSDTESHGQVLVLDGRLITLGSGDLYALDPADGTELWRVPTPDSGPANDVVTDGRVLAVPILGIDQSLTLHAFDPADGRTLWTAPLAERLQQLSYLVVSHGRILAVTDRALVSFG